MQVIWALLGFSQIGLLIAWAMSLSQQYALIPFAIAFAAFKVVSSVALACLSYMQHSKSLRPSGFICIYLLATLLLDVSIYFTLWNMDHLKAPAVFYVVSMGIKLLLLFLELRSKQRILLPEWHAEGPEATSNIFSRSTFWWLNSLMVRGYKDNASISTFYALDRELRSERLLNRLFVTWRPKHDASKYAVLKPLFAACWPAIRPCFFPRTCMIVLRLARPILVNSVIQYMDNANRRLDEGLYLIGATAFVYGGFAVRLFPKPLNLHC